MKNTILCVFKFFLVAPHIREYGATHEALHVDYLFKPAPSSATRNPQSAAAARTNLHDEY